MRFLASLGMTWTWRKRAGAAPPLPLHPTKMIVIPNGAKQNEESPIVSQSFLIKKSTEKESKLTTDIYLMN